MGGRSEVDGLDVFQELFVALVTIFEDMSLIHDDICNNDTATKASNFLKLTTYFDFVSLVIARSVLDRTLPVTQLLQSKTADVLDGLHLISSLKTLGHSMREDVDYFHDVWYQEALLKINLQHLEDNVIGQTNQKIVFRTVITIHFLNYLNNEPQQRFDTSNMTNYN